MGKVIKIKNDEGVPFNVRLEEKGDKCGVKFSLAHDKQDPLVEFYDASVDKEKFTEYGQFVSSYYLSTLLGHTDGVGLILHGGVDSWEVSDRNMDEIKQTFG